jgi:hypothetical protein
MPTVSVVQILTASIAPVIVISGVGLLLLSITNRYGRVIDRARLLARDLAESDPESARRRHLNDQLRFTNRRAHMLRSSALRLNQRFLCVAEGAVAVCRAVAAIP